MRGMAKVLEAIIAAAKEAWNNMPESVLNSLCDYMVERVQAVIRAEGWYTRY